MTSTETIFNNLYILLSQTQLLVNGAPTGGNAFVTTGRQLPQVSAVGEAIQPAMYILEGEQVVEENAIALAKYELKCAAFIFFRNPGGVPGPGNWASTQLNNLRDAFIFQLQQRTLAYDFATVIPLLGGQKQTLGGVVYHARVKGMVLANEGLQNNQAALAFPISILSGM
jgi:hypothetical protein